LRLAAVFEDYPIWRTIFLLRISAAEVKQTPFHAIQHKKIIFNEKMYHIYRIPFCIPTYVAVSKALNALAPIWLYQ